MTDLPRPVVAIPLRDAALCLSCEAIFYLGGVDHCPLCADAHFRPLEKIIGSVRLSNDDLYVNGAFVRPA